jgi:hypothetical protein
MKIKKAPNPKKEHNKIDPVKTLLKKAEPLSNHYRVG